MFENMYVLILLGLILLSLGGEVLVKGASRLAGQLGVPPLIIGLTIVAFGTSAPELTVSLNALLVSGNADLSLTNVVGSNIFNTLAILGLCSLMQPIRVQSQILRWDTPVMVAVTALLYVFALWNASLARWEGLVFLALAVAYNLILIVKAKTEKAVVKEEFDKEYKTSGFQWSGVLMNIGWIALGLVLLVYGADWLVDGAVTLARSLNIPDTIIGLTLVAAGTSLPELATSVIAAFRREGDIAVGNVVGSNIFNILLILGASASLSPKAIPVDPVLLRLDLPLLVGIAAICLPIFYTKQSVSRWEGAGLLAGFVGYLFFRIF